MLTKKAIRLMGGDASMGMLFHQICYWYRLNSKDENKLRVKKEGYLWIAKTYEQWEGETGMPVRKLMRIVDRMVASNIIFKGVYKFNGVTTLHIRLDEKVKNLVHLLDKDEVKLLKKGDVRIYQNGNSHLTNMASQLNYPSGNSTSTKMVTSYITKEYYKKILQENTSIATDSDEFYKQENKNSKVIEEENKLEYFIICWKDAMNKFHGEDIVDLLHQEKKWAALLIETIPVEKIYPIIDGILKDWSGFRKYVLQVEGHDISEYPRIGSIQSCSSLVENYIQEQKLVKPVLENKNNIHKLVFNKRKKSSEKPINGVIHFEQYWKESMSEFQEGEVTQPFTGKEKGYATAIIKKVDNDFLPKMIDALLKHWIGFRNYMLDQHAEKISKVPSVGVLAGCGSAAETYARDKVMKSVSKPRTKVKKKLVVTKGGL